MGVKHCRLRDDLAGAERVDASQLLQNVTTSYNKYELTVTQANMYAALAPYELSAATISDIEAALYSQHSAFKEFVFYTSYGYASLKAVCGVASRIEGTLSANVRFAVAVASGTIVQPCDAVARYKWAGEWGRIIGKKKFAGYENVPRALTAGEVALIQTALKYKINQTLLPELA